MQGIFLPIKMDLLLRVSLPKGRGSVIKFLPARAYPHIFVRSPLPWRLLGPIVGSIFHASTLRGATTRCGICAIGKLI